METLLIIVTVIALAMAIAMSGVVVKLLREERQRSAARIAALTAAVEESGEKFQHATSYVQRADVQRADVLQPPSPKRVSAEAGREKPRAGYLTIDPREPAWDMRDLDLNVARSTSHVAPEHVAPQHVAPEHVARRTPRVAREHVAPSTPHVAPASALPRFGEAGLDAGASLFAAPQPSSPWGARLAVAAALAGLVGIGGYALLHRSTATAGQPTAAAQSAPLELLSLSHKQQAASLVVTGLVQNPRTGAPISNVVATAFLFAADNTFLGSGRAALDYSTLAPGDESPFVITIAVTAPVARYRVGFRDESGRVIAHVDRRANSTMAQIAR